MRTPSDRRRIETGPGPQGLTPLHLPIPYLQRIRAYYAGLGYGAPYVWAHYGDVPFRPLAKPLSACRVGLVTTAAPFKPDAGDQGPRASYNAAAKFYTVYSADTASDPDLRIAHVAIDRDHTTAEDQASYLPLAAMRRAAAAGRIGDLGGRLHGLPTNRSHRHTLDVDCRELLARCLEDHWDAAVLVPNCPVCHQSVSLAARHLEANGIATVIMGCAKDIVEYVGVPRLLFSDFPLGNAAGRPHDSASQDATLEIALRLLQCARAARTTVHSPQHWHDSAEWKLDYCNIERLSAAEINQRRAEFDRQKAAAADLRAGLPDSARAGGGADPGRR